MDEVKVFKVTSNPILRTDRGTRQIMLDVIIGLIPALAVAVYMFGAKVVLLLAVSIVSCVFFEWGYRKLMKKNTTSPSTSPPLRIGAATDTANLPFASESMTCCAPPAY